MKSIQAVKEKVCMMFLAVGICLATVHEVGCFHSADQVAATQFSVVQEILIIAE